MSGKPIQLPHPSALLLLAACGRGWSPEAALQPHLARLDADRNGSVEAKEYEALRRVGPPFAQVDRDRDGVLITDELAFLLRFQDPTGFDHVEIDADLRPASFGVIRLDDNARKVSEVVIGLCDSLAARGQPTPDPARLSAAIAEGDLNGPLTQAILGELHGQYVGLGLTWPSGLPTGGSPQRTEDHPSVPGNAP